MKISKKCEYAFLALITLAYLYDEKLATIEEIAEENDIPKKYLEQILLQLKTSGYVRSIRGKNGGYMLAKHPREISVAEIIRLIEGPIAPVESVSKYYYASTPIEKNQNLIRLFQDIRNMVSDKLENTSFYDLL